MGRDTLDTALNNIIPSVREGRALCVVEDLLEIGFRNELLFNVALSHWLSEKYRLLWCEAIRRAYGKISDDPAQQITRKNGISPAF